MEPDDGLLWLDLDCSADDVEDWLAARSELDPVTVPGSSIPTRGRVRWRRATRY